MKTCDRSWEAEALADGRLDGLERTSFERHAALCTTCRGERDALAALCEPFLALAVAEPSPLEWRRMRVALLRRAHEPAPPFPLRAIGLGIAFAAAVVILATRSGTPRTHDIAKPDVVVKASQPAAVVETTEEPAVEPPVPPPPAPIVHPHRAAPPPTSPHVNRAGILFDEGVASFAAGSYASAEVQLEHFGREFPDDPRAEDALYLRAVAKSRAGDTQGARALSRTYLDTYPNGFRRTEAARLAR